jgi:hypothetical protein
MNSLQHLRLVDSELRRLIGLEDEARQAEIQDDKDFVLALLNVREGCTVLMRQLGTEGLTVNTAIRIQGPGQGIDASPDPS